jgi:hypothetical protein
MNNLMKTKFSSEMIINLTGLKGTENKASYEIEEEIRMPAEPE